MATGCSERLKYFPSPYATIVPSICQRFAIGADRWVRTVTKSFISITSPAVQDSIPKFSFHASVEECGDLIHRPQEAVAKFDGPDAEAFARQAVILSDGLTGSVCRAGELGSLDVVAAGSDRRKGIGYFGSHCHEYLPLKGAPSRGFVLKRLAMHM